MPPQQDPSSDPNLTPPAPAGGDTGSVINVSTPGNDAPVDPISSPAPVDSPVDSFASPAPTTPSFDAPAPAPDPTTVASATPTPSAFDTPAPTPSDSFGAAPQPSTPAFGADPAASPSSAFPTPTPTTAGTTPTAVGQPGPGHPADVKKGSGKKGLMIAAIAGAVIILLMLGAVLIFGQSASDSTDLNTDTTIDTSVPQ